MTEGIVDHAYCVIRKASGDKGMRQKKMTEGIVDHAYCCVTFVPDLKIYFVDHA